MKKVAIRVVLVLLGLELCYLAVANTLLRYGLVSDWVTSSDFFLTYDSAYTLFPARAHVENLRLRTSDPDLQLELQIDEASVDIKLLALLDRRFEGTRVRTRGTSFKLRYKLDKIGDHNMRVAAYPPIEGYEGPPLREGPRPKATQAQKQERWTVRLEDVVAHVDELWFVEYHYQGQALAKGTFEFKPGVLLELESSRLEFEAGTLSVGDRVVADPLKGVLTAETKRIDLGPIQGSQLFGELSATFDAKLRGGNLTFLDVYLKPRLGITTQGPFELALNVAVEAGKVSSDTVIELQAPNTLVHAARTSIEGDLAGKVSVVKANGQERLRVALNSHRLHGQGTNAPTARAVQASLQLSPANISKPLETTAMSFDVKQLSAPSLQWFERWISIKGFQLAGAATLSGNWSQAKDEAPAGELQLELSNTSVAKGDFALRLDADLRSRFASSKDEDVVSAFDQFELSVADAILRLGGENSDPWSATLRSNSLRVLKEPLAAQGTFDAKVQGAGALVPLLMADLPAKVSAVVLDLDKLDARVAAYVSGDLQRVEILKAHSGAVTLSGTWQQRASSTSAAFLLRTDVMNVGMTLSGGEVDLTAGASEDFLSQTSLGAP